LELFQRLVIKYGADVNYRSVSHPCRLLPYSLCLCFDQNYQLWAGHIIYPILTIALQHNADINCHSADQHGGTLLTRLCEYTMDTGYMKVPGTVQFINQLSRFLLQHRADMNLGYCYSNGWKVLHIACHTSNVPLVQLLLEHYDRLTIQNSTI
jgi:Ankyrin repeat